MAAFLRLGPVVPLAPIVALGFMMLVGCARQAATSSTAQHVADREAIEETLNRANVGFELSDADLFASAFAADAVYQLDEPGPVFGYDKLLYHGRDDIRGIITTRLEKARNA